MTVSPRDADVIREHIDGFASEIDQNRCVNAKERAEVEADRLAAHAELDALLARVHALEQARDSLQHRLDFAEALLQIASQGFTATQWGDMHVHARAVVLEGAARQEQTQDLGVAQSAPCEGSGGEQL